MAALRPVTKLPTQPERPALRALPPLMADDGWSPEVLKLSRTNDEREVQLVSRVHARVAASLGRAHAVTIAGTDESSDADYLQIVDQVHAASDATSIVIHPGPTAERGVLDKRWSTLMEHASARHKDLRLLARLSGPATMR